MSRAGCALDICVANLGVVSYVAGGSAGRCLVTQLNSPWFVSYVVPRMEHSFCSRMSLFNVRSYVPMRTYFTKPRHKKQSIRCQCPMFPGYVFVEYAAPDVLQKVESTDSFLYLLKMLEQICFLSPEFIESMQQAESNGEFVEEKIVPTTLSVHDRVVFLAGVLEGYTALVTKTGQGKVTLDMGGGTVNLHLASLLENSYRRVSDDLSDLAAPSGERQLGPGVRTR